MSESRQRWRLVFSRGEEARFLSHLDTAHAWERALKRGDIPVSVTDGFTARPKLVFAAPLPLGMLAEHELADLILAERLTRPDLRDRLTAALPRGYGLVDLYDEWVGAPAVATRLAAADYRATLLGVAAAPLAEAIRRLLAASALPRERRREKKVTAYDLRPLLLDLRTTEVDSVAARDLTAAPDPAAEGMPAAGLWMRLRASQEAGTGRVEEVVAALAVELGMRYDPVAMASEEPAVEGSASDSRPALDMVRSVRERLWLAEELSLRSDETSPGTNPGLPPRR